MAEIELSQQGEVGVVTIDRPPVNAIGLEMLVLLKDGLEELLHTSKAMVLTSSSGVFCAGADVKAFASYSPEQRREFARVTDEVFEALYAAPIPTIAALPGHALGGGLIVALTCDVRLAARGDYKLGLPQLAAGVPFPARALDVARAELPVHVLRRLILGAEILDPAAAREAGLVDELVDPDELLERAVARAVALAGFPVYADTKARLRRLPSKN